jgi:hypothetical protein
MCLNHLTRGSAAVLAPKFKPTLEHPVRSMSLARGFSHLDRTPLRAEAPVDVVHQEIMERQPLVPWGRVMNRVPDNDDLPPLKRRVDWLAHAAVPCRVLIQSSLMPPNLTLGLLDDHRRHQRYEIWRRIPAAPFEFPATTAGTRRVRADLRIGKPAR